MKKKNIQIMVSVIVLVIIFGLGSLYLKYLPQIHAGLVSSQPHTESIKNRSVQSKNKQDNKKSTLLTQLEQSQSKKTDTKEVIIDTTVPKIVANPKIVDFGTIRKIDGLVSANITIKNDGHGSLLLSYAFTSCGCTVAPLKKQSLLAGESTKLEVSYDPNYFGKYYGLGQVEKKVTILSNDPQNSLYTVKLKANVLP